jgi:hypothetical protein
LALRGGRDRRKNDSNHSDGECRDQVPAHVPPQRIDRRSKI